VVTQDARDRRGAPAAGVTTVTRGRRPGHAASPVAGRSAHLALHPQWFGSTRTDYDNPSQATDRPPATAPDQPLAISFAVVEADLISTSTHWHLFGASLTARSTTTPIKIG
jgi:hypothetical protein